MFSQILCNPSLAQQSDTTKTTNNDTSQQTDFCWTLHSSFWPYFKNQKRECFVVWGKTAPKNSELPSFFGDPWGNEKIRGGFSKFAKGFPFFSKHDQPFFGKFHMWPHRDSQKRELVSSSSTDSRDYWSIVLKYDSLLSSNTKYSHAKMKSTTKCLVKHGEITLLKMEIMVVWVWWKSYRPWNRQDASLLLCTSSLMTSWSKMASTLTLELWKGKLHRMYGNIYKIYDKWLVI